MEIKMVNKYCDILFKYPKSILSIIIIITIGCAFLYSKLPVETSVESLIMEDDPDLLFYNTFKEQFGEDEFLVVGFSEPRIFSPAYLRFIQKLTEQFENIEEVDDVVSLTNVEDIIGSEDDFIVEPLVKEVPDDPDSIETIKHRALTNPLIEGNLVSSDGKAALFVIRTKSHPDDETYDARLIRKVKEVLENRPDQFRHINFHLAGWLVTDVNMSSYMNKDLKSLMPLTYALIIGLLVFFLRNGWAVFLSILNVSICLVCTMAVLYLAGGAVSPMTAILPPLIMALSVSDSVHIFTEFLKKRPVSSAIASTNARNITTFMGSLFSYQSDHRSRLCFLVNQQDSPNPSLRAGSGRWDDDRILPFNVHHPHWHLFF